VHAFRRAFECVTISEYITPERMTALVTLRTDYGVHHARTTFYDYSTWSELCRSLAPNGEGYRARSR
jgi:hypothetical protein